MPDQPANPLLTDLTDAQRQAVERTEGPVLILAAAGSGKTRVITRRIAYLLSLGVPSWQILALTFTNKAAGEMRERVYELLAEHPRAERVQRGLTITTFHSLCARLLRKYAPLMDGKPRWGLNDDYTIYDTADQLALMKRVITSLDMSTSNWSPRSVLSAISGAKNELKDAADYSAEAGDFYSKSVARIFDAYEKSLRAANAVDFDDLLLLTVRMLKECPEARDEVQQRWQYLMIDEYQDTNRAQFILSTLLVGHESGRSPNVCVVGDPDQSIYGWRGADITNILEFEEQHPDAHVITLGQNFRSTAPILAAADSLIRHNRRRKHKDLYTTREGGDRPMVVLCRDEHHEAQLVVDWLRRLHMGEDDSCADGDRGPGLARDPIPWKEMAIFYRNNALSRVMEDALRAAGIPYVIARGTAFYQREEVKDAIAYLRIVANPADDVSLRRIINKPARKIGATSVSVAGDFAESNNIPLFEALQRVREIDGLSTIAVNGIAAFIETVHGWTGQGTFMGADISGSLSELVGRVLKESGLEAYYKSPKRQKNEEDAQRLANLEELVSSAHDFELAYDVTSDPALGPTPEELRNAGPAADSTPPLLAMLRAYLESVSLVADADEVDPASGAVTLMTLHAAKGLEYPAAAIIGLEEMLLPSARALDSSDGLEEERRLCFVGMTRAMQHLLMTSAKYRTHRGISERTVPSRFLRELPEDQIIVSDQSDEGHGDADGYTYEPFGDDGEPLSIEQVRAMQGRGGRRAGGRSAASEQYPVGSAVRHPQFGVGRVLSISPGGSNARARIEFKSVGTKTLVLEYARLERIF